MSLAHFISLQKKIPDFDHFVNGKAIAHACDALEAIAVNLKVTPIMEFYGRKWHHPDRGLETVSALIGHLTEHPSLVEEPDYVIDDLKDWERVLMRAKADNIKWKMQIDY